MNPPHSSTRRIRSAALGQTLLVREWATGGSPHGDALLLHGLGDHSGRHDWAAGLIGRAGYRPIGFDWPGNGESDGTRGDMPTMEESCQLLDEATQSLDLAPSGIFAHSTGAFLLLSWLARRSGQDGALHRLRWVWLSSPLLRPSHGQPPLKIAIARTLARRFPKMTLGTGVRAKDCFHTGFAPFAESARKRAGGHHRVSLRFATDLLASEGVLLEKAERIDRGIAFLLTQGTEDRICPSGYAEELFQRLPAESKTWILASGARHEPFREPEPEGIENAARVWLEWQGRGRTLPANGSC